MVERTRLAEEIGFVFGVTRDKAANCSPSLRKGALLIRVGLIRAPDRTACVVCGGNVYVMSFFAETAVLPVSVFGTILPALFFCEAVTQAVLESTCVFKLVKAMKTFANTRSLQWKVCLAGT